MSSGVAIMWLRAELLLCNPLCIVRRRQDILIIDNDVFMEKDVETFYKFAEYVLKLEGKWHIICRVVRFAF